VTNQTAIHKLWQSKDDICGRRMVYASSLHGKPKKMCGSMEIVKNRFSNLTKEQLGQDQQGKDIANEHQ